MIFTKYILNKDYNNFHKSLSSKKLKCKGKNYLYLLLGLKRIDK